MRLRQRRTEVPNSHKTVDLEPQAAEHKERVSTFLHATYCYDQCLCRAPIWGHEDIYVTVGHLRPSCCEAPILTRGPVGNLLLQFPATLTHGHSLLSNLTSPTWRARPPCLYPRDHCGPVILPGTVFPYSRLSRLTGLRWGYSNLPPHGEESKSESVYLTTDGQSASLSWCQVTIRTRDQYCFPLEIFFAVAVCCFVTPTLTRGRVC
jgi:hypothetical protein